MRNMHLSCMRTGIGVLVLALPLVAAGQAKPSISSTSQITIHGGGFDGQTLTLSKASGDWFSTANDAHANLDFENPEGPQHVIIQLQFDGKDAAHTITHDTNDTVVGTGHSTFYLMLPGDGINMKAAAPHDSDVVTVTVTRMDDNALDAKLTGVATADGKVRFEGTLSVRRMGAHPLKSSGAWHDCDPQIHDKMVGAEARSPSECEQKFDSHVREALGQAFAPVMAQFSQGDWTAKQPNMGPVEAMARYSETKPYHLDSAIRGAFKIDLELSPNSEEYQRRAAAYREAMEKASQQVADAMKSGTGGQATIEKMAATMNAQSEAMAIKISVGINNGSLGMTNFKGTHTVSSLPGGGTVLFVPGAQASTGGGADSAEAVTLVLVGPWGQVTSKSLGADGERVEVKGGLLPGKPVLAVQNVLVRIRTSPELAQKVIEKVDWERVRGLVGDK
jgi:hypothetical protein